MDLTFDHVRIERGGRLVLDIPSLRIRGGRTTAILGPNGSGKTTLLRAIAGLERPRTGHITIAAQERSVRLQPDEAQRVAYVFQEEVFLRRSVRENLELGLRLRGVDRARRRERVEQAAELLDVVHLLDRRADQLSGGEGRRVSLARALCLGAPLVLLDEPLEGLDERTYVRLLDELPRLLAAFDATTLLVTHNRRRELVQRRFELDVDRARDVALEEKEECAAGEEEGKDDDEDRSADKPEPERIGGDHSEALR